ncbi:DUF6188 family protein [Lysinibacillus sp. SGAir0095]|uniref:DUF6188 family protein n=1 Tax=Lysinibacillus sp. SGAir0095 TaxID=2070463 RepID=UPI0010CCD529|nr:DUF6188 family protein [Lysinibacillus sp. SGAir0095]QCR31178.1 hypothetical protein C1N55_02955 [Lysinibacillus sp. SGAir0095]
MYKTLSKLDFQYFIGQEVTEVNTEKNYPFGVSFERGVLTIECPWRLRVSSEVAIGYSDCLQAPGQYSHKDVEKILMGKRITNIFHYEEISDLVVEFEGKIYLELFHDSNYFEGWQLRGENGMYVFTLPGGAYSD